MSLLRCPVCGELFEADETTAMPFCGARCRRIDLQRWLGEQYGLPYESRNDSSDSGPEDAGSNAR
jgi:endogenous inhibitor of DNA gyrase (YacG/DUF329 family)